MATAADSAESLLEWLVDTYIDSISYDLILQAHLLQQGHPSRLPPSSSSSSTSSYFTSSRPLRSPSCRPSSDVKASLSRAYDDQQSLSSLPRPSPSIVPPNAPSYHSLLHKRRRVGGSTSPCPPSSSASSGPPPPPSPPSFSPYLDIWGRLVPKDPLVQIWLSSPSSHQQSDVVSSSSSSSGGGVPSALNRGVTPLLSNNVAPAANAPHLQLVLKKDVPCTKCSRRIAISKFAAHLEKCMNLAGASRTAEK